jgi:hypothetical protein
MSIPTSLSAWPLVLKRVKPLFYVLEHLEQLLDFGHDLGLTLADLAEGFRRVLGGMASFLSPVAPLLSRLPGTFMHLPHDLVRQASAFRVVPPVLLGLPAPFRVFPVPLCLLTLLPPALVARLIRVHAALLSVAR